MVITMIPKEGIVVKTIQYQDNTKIVYIINNTGKVSLIARGANNIKSPNYQNSQELIKLKYDDKNNKYLTNGKVICFYQNIKNDFDKMKSVLKIIEISYILIDYVNDHQTFYEFLTQILDYIEKGINPKLLELIFRIKLLYLLGIEPVLTKCVTCETKENLIGFSFYSGGMKCDKCYHNDDFLFPLELINMIKTLYLVKLNILLEKITLIKYDYIEMDRFLNLYYNHYIGYTSKVDQVYHTINNK